MKLGSKSSGETPLGTTYTAIALDELPLKLKGGVVAMVLTEVVTATEVTWYLSADEDGDEPLTPEATDDIISRTSGKGGIASSLDGAVLATWSVDGTIYVQAKLDGGTANAVARLAWEN